MATALVVSMMGTVAYAGVYVSGTFKMGDYLKVSGSEYKSDLRTQATLSITRNVGNDVYLNDSSFQVLFKSANDKHTSSTIGSISYPGSSGTASYYKNQAYNVNYYASAKLGPTSRYASLQLKGGSFTP